MGRPAQHASQRPWERHARVYRDVLLLNAHRTSWPECAQIRSWQPEIPPHESPYTTFAILLLMCPQNSTQCAFPCCLRQIPAKPARQKSFQLQEPSPSLTGPCLVAHPTEALHGVPFEDARACAAKNLLPVDRTSGLEFASFQSCSGLCAERARRRPQSTPWTPDTRPEYCQRFWHGARLRVC